MSCLKPFCKNSLTIAIVFLVTFLLLSQCKKIAFAGMVPEVEGFIGFFSQKEVNDLGQVNRLGSSSSFGFSVASAFILNRRNNTNLRLGVQNQRIVFLPPYNTVLTTNTLNVYRASASISTDAHLFTLGVGGSYGRQSLIHAQSAASIYVSTVNAPEAWADITYRVIALEYRALRVGVRGLYLFQSSAADGVRFLDGKGLNAHIDLEFRGEIRTRIFARYETMLLNTNHGNQESSDLVLGLQFAFPGKQGLYPPSDER